MDSATINLLIALVSIILAIAGTGIAIAVVVTKIFEKSIETLKVEIVSVQKAVAVEIASVQKAVAIETASIQKAVAAGTAEHGKLWEAHNKQGERLDALLLALVSPESAREALQSRSNLNQ
ncbi:MAG: hypothetical protein OXE81_07680 [Gammaproteobacteria bacterium]|nr:hypothetical protein [Gammaproteobacteria bacterium]MCY4277701.1 hypothetical protein [Gammaproteobacteria bacterium]